MIYRKYKFLIIQFIAVLLLLSMCSCVFIGLIGLKFYMFNDIDECKKIEENASEDAVVEILDASDDKCLKGIEYETFYGYSYKSKAFDFKLFAYEFSNNEKAQKYYKNVTGRTEERDAYFFDSSGLTQFRRIVVDNNKVYAVYSSPGEYPKANEYLSQVFSKVLFEDW